MSAPVCAFAATTASRNEQSALQAPSLVSLSFVTLNVVASALAEETKAKALQASSKPSVRRPRAMFMRPSIR